MIRLRIPREHIHTTLDRAGYHHHYKVNHGWLRELDAYTRWHAHYDGTFLEVHQDRTDRQSNLHFVARLSPHAEQKEYGRIWSALQQVSRPKVQTTKPNPKSLTSLEKQAKRERHEALMKAQQEAKKNKVPKKKWNTKPWGEIGGKNVFAPNLVELQRSIGKRGLRRHLTDLFHGIIRH
jgi:hypothetical protein